MHLAAMLDAGVDEGYLRLQLERLNLGGYRLVVEKKICCGVFGTQVTVCLDAENQWHGVAGNDHGCGHRNLGDIIAIIADSRLDAGIKSRAAAIFTRLARAEAAVHGTTVEEVHFHEVGAVDSIVDIVGAAICLEYLAADRIVCSTVELGGGYARCQHGILPVPAPATVELTKGIPVSRGRQGFEATTPTGAAILATVVDTFSDRCAFTASACGYGIGHKVGSLPNMLRIFIGEACDIPAGTGAQ